MKEVWRFFDQVDFEEVGQQINLPAIGALAFRGEFNFVRVGLLIAPYGGLGRALLRRFQRRHFTKTILASILAFTGKRVKFNNCAPLKVNF